MPRPLKLAVAAFVSAALATSAHAATITYAQPNPMIFRDYGPNLTSLPQFDPSLGTLSSARFAVTGDFTFLWDNRSSTDLSGDIAFGVGLRLDEPGIIDSDHVVANRWDAQLYGGWDSSFDGPIAPGQHTSAPDPVSFAVNASGDLSGLIGTGTVESDDPFHGQYGLMWSEDSDVCRDNADELNQLGRLSCSSAASNFMDSVTYTYDPATPPANPVPEPTSAALLLAGIVAIYTRRREI